MGFIPQRALDDPSFFFWDLDLPSINRVLLNRDSQWSPKQTTIDLGGFAQLALSAWLRDNGFTDAAQLFILRQIDQPLTAFVRELVLCWDTAELPQFKLGVADYRYVTWTGQYSLDGFWDLKTYTLVEKLLQLAETTISVDLIALLYNRVKSEETIHAQSSRGTKSVHTSADAPAQ